MAFEKISIVREYSIFFCLGEDTKLSSASLQISYDVCMQNVQMSN